MVIQMVQNNLDYLCAKYGQEIPECKSDGTAIQKSLGVLQEDGLFAFILYLESKNDAINHCTKKEIAKLLNKVELTQNANENNMRENIHKITKNIDNMFLAKDLIEKTLIYARYRAKALEK